MNMTELEKSKYEEMVAEVGEGKAFDLWLAWKCQTDLFFLGNEVFGWDKAKKGRKSRVDPELHRWLCNILTLPGSKMVLIPRLHLKSTWVKANIVQDILNDPDIRIGLVSSAARLVEQELADIKRLLATPLLRRLFPDIIPDPGKDYKGWQKSTANELTVYRNKPIQAPQVTALGAGAEITGTHWDKIYSDDIISPKNVTTVDQLQKSLDWWKYIQSIGELDCEYTITGTPYHYNDLYATIKREGHISQDRIFVRSAIENGKPIYRTWFTLDALQLIKKRQGNYIFSCQYMCDATPKEEMMFPGPQPTFNVLPADEYSFYFAIDPAATTQAYSDHTGFVIGAVDRLNRIWVVEAMALKIPGNELADLLIRKCLQYKPVRIGIEFGLQEHLKFIIEAQRQNYEQVHKVSVPMNILPIKVSRSMSKGDRINQTLGSFVREGKFVINERCSELINQMDMFTGKEGEADDVIDAASMIFYCVERFAFQYWIEPQGIRDNYPTIFDLVQKTKSDSWRKNFAA